MGKSSLLSQIHPLPADLKNDYKKDGYKYIKFDINGVTYVSSSGYVGTNKHSFQIDGKELNIGGTSTVQKQLAQEHFKLTPSIINILLGTDRLTTMGPTTRKHWFSMLSPIDYSFSIGVWNALRSRTRDITGSIKVLQDDLIKKSDSKITREDIDGLVKRTKELDSRITNMSQELIKIVKPDSKDLNIDTVFKTYDKAYFLLEDIKSKVTGITKDNASFKLGEYETKYKEVVNKYDTKAKQINLLNELKDKETISKLRTTQVELSSKLKELDTILPSNRIKGTSRQLQVDLKDMYSKISYHVDIILSPELSNLGSRKELLELNNNLDTYRERYNKLKVKHVLLSNDIKELTSKGGTEVSCPKCNHDFTYSPHGKITSIQQQLVTIEKEMKQIQETMVIKDKAVKSIETKIEHTDKVKQLLNHKLLLPFIDIDKVTISNMLNTLNSTIVKVDKFIEYEDIEHKLYEVNNQISIHEKTQELVKELGVDTKESLEEEIVKLTDQKRRVNDTIQLIKDYMEIEKKIDHCVRIAQEYQELKSKEYKYLIDSKRNNLLLESIGNLKLELSTIQKQLQDVNSNDKYIEELQKTITKNKVKVSVLKKMLLTLSPESGLIAKSINSFLNKFLSEMNHIINSVWKYSMIILPCEIGEDKDLNYRFKVKVNDDEVIEDISKLSSSMEEIVNLAFKIVFVKYLGISGFPLILDEFGRTMDPEHRVAAYDIIDKVLAHNFNQIILVCHFESMYSRFNNGDFIELKESKCSL